MKRLANILKKVANGGLRGLDCERFLCDGKLENKNRIFITYTKTKIISEFSRRRLPIMCNLNFCLQSCAKVIGTL